MELPVRIENVRQLEELLSRPSETLVGEFSQMAGDLLLLGVGGKMGPTLARMARRALDAAGRESTRVIGVSRFSSGDLQERLHAQGIECIACDLLDRSQLEALPRAENVIYMPALKFGARGQEARTWATNAYLPGLVCEAFSRSRIVAFSTGNVYGLTPIESGGSKEGDPRRPVGDYAMSCLGRERIFEHFSQALGTPVALVRLNYAVEMRYGVLVDLARQVLAGEAVDLAMGHLNVIWQGDANEATLRLLRHAASPARPVNITGPELLSVRCVALELARQLGRDVLFEGAEAPDALLSDASVAHSLLGRPSVRFETLLAWVADWVRRGGESLGKPTKFSVRDGEF